MPKFRIGLDLDGDGWINWEGALAAPNLIPYPLWQTAFTGSGHTLTTSKEITPYGLLLHSFVLNSGAASLRLVAASGGAPVSVSQPYTLVAFARAATPATFNARVINQLDSTLLTGASLTVGTSWTPILMNYTPAAPTTHLRLMIEKLAGSPVNTIEVAGLGVYSGTYRKAFFNSGGDLSPQEDLSSYLLGFTTRCSFGRDYARMIPEDGDARIVLDNRTKAFSPRYAASPYYGLLDVLQLLRVEIALEQDVWEPLWTGYLDSIEVTAGKWGDRQTILHGVQGVMQMDDAQVKVDPEIDVRAEDMLRPLLETSHLPADRYSAVFDQSQIGRNSYLYAADDVTDIHSGSYKYPITGSDWKEQTTVRKATNDVVLNEQGFAYIDREGKFCFRNRNELFENSSSFHVVVDQDYQLASYLHNSRRTSSVEARFRPRELFEGVIWRVKNADPILLEPGKTVYMNIEPKTTEGFSIFVTDVEPFSRQADALSWYDTEVDATGVGMYARTKVTLRYHPGYTFLRFNNKSERATARITGELYGYGWYSKDEVSVSARSQTALESNKGREQRIVLNLNLIPEIDQAEEVAEAVLNRTSTLLDGIESITYRFGMREKNWQRLAGVFAMNIGSTVFVTEAQTDMDNVPHLLRSETYSYAGGVLEVEHGLMAVSSDEYAIFDQALIGVNTNLGY